MRTDQAQIDNAKLQLVYCNITAPFTGRVGLRQVDPGNIVHATDTNPMLILTQLQPIAVIFTCRKISLPIVAQHMKQGTLSVDAYSRDDQTKLATGKLLTIDNQIDPDDRHRQAQSGFRQQRQPALAQSVRERRLLLETAKNSTVVANRCRSCAVRRARSFMR